MGAKQRFAIQSAVVTVALNAVLLAAIFVLLGDEIQVANQTVVVLVVGVVITLVLWLLNYVLGSRLIAEEPVQTLPADAAPRAVPAAPAKVRAEPQAPARLAESGAVQMLAILQRQGRLIDFLREDVRQYDDAQIGAAVRTIHEGCRSALDEHVTLEPIFNDAEGSMVGVPAGFDPRAVRLTGHVVGEPPFRGELRHRGWRVVRIDLPQQADVSTAERIVAAAEVEVQR